MNLNNLSKQTLRNINDLAWALNSNNDFDEGNMDMKLFNKFKKGRDEAIMKKKKVNGDTQDLSLSMV